MNAIQGGRVGRVVRLLAAKRSSLLLVGERLAVIAADAVASGLSKRLAVAGCVVVPGVVCQVAAAQVVKKLDAVVVEVGPGEA
jgi:hypothetical protein